MKSIGPVKGALFNGLAKRVALPEATDPALPTTLKGLKALKLENPIWLPRGVIVIGEPLVIRNCV